MTNRLAGSISPYLLQHQDNPVDWWPWCDEAFAQARRLDRPVLLSVGYAACHWCHVMAHESFEDRATAEIMNTGFVNIKVDREERPDVDAVYLKATQALTGHGGWPMTVFLTPDGQPFYAGTYFPPQPAEGTLSFTQVLSAIDQAWHEQRGDLLAAGRRVCVTLAARGLPTRGSPLGDHELAGLVAAAVTTLTGQEDDSYAGFGGAPKFPPSMDLEFLLRHAATDAATAGQARELAGRTLRVMAHSGLYDQIDGGFARYAVDRAWVVPHFEKMLYDNAMLARVYLHWWRLVGEPTGARIALETCEWMMSAVGPAGRWVRVVLGRRHQRARRLRHGARRRGVQLCLDAWPTGRGSRPGRRPLGRRPAARHRAWDLRTRQLDRCNWAVTSGPTRSRPSLALGPRAAAGGQRPPSAAGARRQDRGRLERSGDRGARGDRCARWTGPTSWPRPSVRPTCSSPSTLSPISPAPDHGCGESAVTGWRSTLPACWRTTGTSPRGCWCSTVITGIRRGSLRRCLARHRRWHTSSIMAAVRSTTPRTTPPTAPCSLSPGRRTPRTMPTPAVPAR